MKKLLALVLFILLVALHAACGGGGYSSPTAPGNAPTPMPGAAPTATPVY